MATALRTPASPALVEQRRAERHAVIVTHATVRGHGEPPVSATLADLSIYGCRLLIAEPPEPDTRLWLRLDGGWPIAATVVWADAERIGCRFDAPIANNVVRRFTRGG